MTIKDSIVADRGGTIKNARINKNFINNMEKKSFGWGFITGIITSFIASGIWYFVQTYLIE
jgi:hypothetical protein